MACRLFGAKPLAAPVVIYCQYDHQNKPQRKFNANAFISIFKKTGHFLQALFCYMILYKRWLDIAGNQKQQAAICLFCDKFLSYTGCQTIPFGVCFDKHAAVVTQTWKPAQRPR